MHPKLSIPSFAAILLSCATGATAAQVTELKPADVAAFVARHPHAIVQVTSPDRKCGYCIGADKAFDRAAAADKSGKFAYARVQHTPWRAIPDFGKLMKIYGVPTEVVFGNGQRLGDVMGSPKEPEKFFAEAEAIVADPPALKAPAAEAQAPAPKAPSAAASPAVRTTVRRDLLKGLMDACAARFPAGADRYRKAVADWMAPRKAALEQGTVALMTGDVDVSTVVENEQSGLQAWQSKALGITDTTKVDAASCDQMAARLAADIP